MGSGTSTPKKPMTDPRLSRLELAQRIDHTLLKATLTASDMEHHCQEALEYRFKTVCIPPFWVPFAFHLLSGSEVETITVVGFPLGYTTGKIKQLEAEEAIQNGAREIDLVMNLSAFKSGDLALVEKEIRAVAEACGPIPLKVIIETAYLEDAEKVQAGRIAEAAGAQFVKTSTGFASGVTETGATVSDIELLRSSLKPKTRIKASGGIRNFEGAMRLIRAGADRLGASSGVAILNGLRTDGGY
jgi:deoxyribose-phosphate aldolase